MENNLLNGFNDGLHRSSGVGGETFELSKQMKEQDILKIVEETFSQEIYAEGWLDWGTPMATLCGKEAFMKELEKRLKNLLDENNLSK